jgi:hypothetical protein
MLSHVTVGSGEGALGSGVGIADGIGVEDGGGLGRCVGFADGAGLGD